MLALLRCPSTLAAVRLSVAGRTSLRRVGAGQLLKREFFELPSLPSSLPNPFGGGSRRVYKEEKVLPYTQEQLYNVVSNVDYYYLFIPFCTHSRVLSTRELDPHETKLHSISGDQARHTDPSTSAYGSKPVDKIMKAELGVGYKMFSEKYVSKVTCVYPRKVIAQASDASMFKRLDTTWEFLAVPSSSTPSTKLRFSIDFEFTSPLHAHASELFFDQVSKQMPRPGTNMAAPAQHVQRVQPSRPALQQIEEQYNKRVDDDVERLMDSFVDIVRISAVEDKDTFKTTQEGYQIESQAAQMVRSVESLFSVITDLKHYALLNDTSTLTRLVQTRSEQLRTQKEEIRDNLKDLRKDVTAAIEELQSDKSGTSRVSCNKQQDGRAPFERSSIMQVTRPQVIQTPQDRNGAHAEGSSPVTPPVRADDVRWGQNIKEASDFRELFSLIQSQEAFPSDVADKHTFAPSQNDALNALMTPPSSPTAEDLWQDDPLCSTSQQPPTGPTTMPMTLNFDLFSTSIPLMTPAETPTFCHPNVFPANLESLEWPPITSPGRLPAPADPELPSQNPKHSFLGLPREIQLRILSYLTPLQLIRVRCVSKDWQNLMMDGSLWSVIDARPFYEMIEGERLVELGIAAGKFLRVAHFRQVCYALRTLSQYCPNIEYLDLTGCRSVSQASVACFLAQAQHLKHLDVSCLSSVNNYTLRTISMHCPQLESLNLAWCRNISSVGIQNIAKRCTKLLEFRLNGCLFLDEETCAVIGENLQQLRQLHLGGCTNLQDSAFEALMETCSDSITFLNLSQCHALTDAALKAISESCPRLSHLEIPGGLHFTDEGFTHLFHRVRGFVYIDLEDCARVTDRTVRSIASDQPYLKRLCLSNCFQISDAAVRELLTSGACASTIQHLSLDSCKAITDAVLKTVANLMVHRTSEATKVDAYNDGLSDDGVECSLWPSRSSSALEPIKIEVYDCHKITEEGVKLAQRMTPLLRIRSSFSWREEINRRQERHDREDEARWTTAVTAGAREGVFGGRRRRDTWRGQRNRRGRNNRAETYCYTSEIPTLAVNAEVVWPAGSFGISETYLSSDFSSMLAAWKSSLCQKLMGLLGHAERLQAIQAAIRRKDIDALRRLAREPHGLETDDLRREAWPILLHTNYGKYLQEKSLDQELEDREQIQKDVQRALYFFAQNISPHLKKRRQHELQDIIVEILWRNPKLNYYQGFHDICTIFLLVLGKEDATPAAETVALFFIRDAMHDTFKPINLYLSLMQTLIEYEDPELFEHFTSHDIVDFARVTTLFDLFIASTPLMPVYIAFAVVSSRRQILLKEDPEMLHDTISKIPPNLDWPAITSHALKLEKRYPPLLLQKLSGVWLEDSSAVNTYDSEWLPIYVPRQPDRIKVERYLNQEPRKRESWEDDIAALKAAGWRAHDEPVQLAATEAPALIVDANTAVVGAGVAREDETVEFLNIEGGAVANVIGGYGHIRGKRIAVAALAVRVLGVVQDRECILGAGEIEDITVLKDAGAFHLAFIWKYFAKSSVSKYLYLRHCRTLKGTPKFDELKRKDEERMKLVEKRMRPKSNNFPGLDVKAMQQVQAALRDPKFHREIAAASVGYRDLITLRPGTWLNDEIVNFYIGLILERSKKQDGKLPKVHCFTSFFYSTLVSGGYAKVRRWTKKIDIFSNDYIIIPVNINNAHWCCAAINFVEKRIEYYDSMHHYPGPVTFQRLRDYLNQESLDKRKKPFDFTGWEDYAPTDIPLQLNGSDCGVFVCTFAEFISRNEPFDFAQNNMPDIRRRMIYEISNNSLMDRAPPQRQSNGYAS
ncbi:hypothetical protein BZG36_00144 [Bifiguratus adelaidae]|uniref:F-box domain-containing protein n=1 Tax=Bifiguratus adelaidae TaxID=1938954 RepID=A0A261Y8A9_9FUNG|nr:hypothetical protein BZG36_00144 [Bifiguratus adelaidae]